MSFWYLATPYSKYRYGLEAAFSGACIQAGLLIAAKIPVFSPIAHSHSIAMRCEMDPLDHSIWLPADQPMMDAASGLIVCMLDGWAQSVGIEHEIAAFVKNGRPILLGVLVSQGLGALARFYERTQRRDGRSRMR